MLNKTLTKTILWVRRDEGFEAVGYKWELKGKGINEPLPGLKPGVSGLSQV